MKRYSYEMGHNGLAARVCAALRPQDTSVQQVGTAVETVLSDQRVCGISPIGMPLPTVVDAQWNHGEE